MAPFSPDILVTREDSPEILLVVEVKRSSNARRGTSDLALRSYMAEMGCPVGIMVTPAYVRFYRNRYTDYSPQAVEVTGECLTQDLFEANCAGSVRKFDMERSVEEWLEGLRLGNHRTWPDDVRQAIEFSVAPAISDGIIRAGGPRWRRTG